MPSALPVDRTEVPPVATYANPILDQDFPDPAVLLAEDGYYYAYATQTLRDGAWINIQVARSANLVDWQFLGDAMPAKPAWASQSQDFWAPYVLFDRGRYVMYYSATPDETAGQPSHSLAIAVADRPEGPFVDIGKPLLNGRGFEYIDPMVFRDPVSGRPFLYWGSGFQPIKVQQLADDLMSFEPGSAPTDIIWPNPIAGAFPRLVEAAWVIHHGDHYYIFYSGDNCCGPNAEYGVMVARSRQPMGPFETLEQAKGVPHSLMLTRNERWLAPGHNSIIEDRAGTSWIVYHAIDIERPRQRQEDEINSRRILLIDPIRWEDGWPIVGTPSHGEQQAPRT
ncbi:family 43 glycosylhydrolase [Sphingomonas swuensis]|uniref:Family 43 glycosylhydrolase n=1 Tax=Sphingomonas swuensis TaxID=977800 RepID=A0ABP7TC01_9SPHN